MTMKELAKLANVSPSAVTKAFSGAPDISEETRAHIFEVARAQGCYGKYIKMKYSKPVIAVICPELYGGLYPRYVKTFREFIEEQGGIAVMGDYNFNYEKQDELIEYFASYLQVDGIFCFDIKEPLKKGIEVPVISLGSHSPAGVLAVGRDDSFSLNKAVELLKNKGHKKVAFFGETRTCKKAEAFKKSVSGRVNSKMFCSSLRFEEAGYDCALQMLGENEEYTAVICAYDDIALGAVNCFKSKGLRIPGDISVIGMDNNVTSEHTDPPLASIDIQFDKVCKEAWELYLKKKENKYYFPKTMPVVPSRLVLRGSIGECEK